MGKKNRDRSDKTRVKLVVGDVSRLDLRPGDDLLVRVPKPLGPDEVAGMRQNLALAFAGHRVLLLHGGATLEIVRKAEAAPAPARGAASTAGTA